MEKRGGEGDKKAGANIIKWWGCLFVLRASSGRCVRTDWRIVLKDKDKTWILVPTLPDSE